MYYDYGFILAVLSLVSGVIWLLDIYILKPNRESAAKRYKEESGSSYDEEKLQEIKEEPIYVDYARSFFPVLIVIFLFRSFLFEPFRIPSGSMMPTLLIGDFILVNKFSYGVRLPITHKKIIENGSPERGDVLVFKNPINTSQDYIKRVVGLPGDRIIYGGDKSLTIIPACEEVNKIEGKCGEQITIPINLEKANGYRYHQGEGYYRDLNILNEQLGEVKHQILQDGLVSERGRMLRYSGNNIANRGVWVVPENQYFVLGDNRDNSQDSRYWGFVPEELIVGKAVAVWMHIGLTDEPVLGSWRLPNAIKLGRVGGIE